MRVPILVAFIGLSGGACAVVISSPGKAVSAQRRLEMLKRAQVWAAVDTPHMDLRQGPQDEAAFHPEERISCEYVPVRLSGRSPKFSCAITAEDRTKDDRLKVKYGRDNGEVYGEVAATRLLWALGFAADRMYPVQIVCRECPTELGGSRIEKKTFAFDVAAVERKLRGREVVLADRQGWTWPELDLVDEQAGGAPRAQVEALELLAVFLQHSDSKSEQQRLICLGAGHGDESDESRESEGCEHPWAMLNDVGLTFGAASRSNAGDASSVNLARWSRTHVWRGESGCVGNIAKSWTGTLDHPRISEAGRRFLADLLVQLGDAQLRDLFEVSRFQLRRRAPDTSSPALGSIDEWVSAFKAKRDEIVNRRCNQPA